jgi:hypothetical protein
MLVTGKVALIFFLMNSQSEHLAEFYDFCKHLELARTFQFPTLRQVSYFVSTLKTPSRQNLNDCGVVMRVDHACSAATLIVPSNNGRVHQRSTPTLN